MFRYQAILSIVVVLATLSVAQHGCPEPYGVQTYPDEKYCDRFFKVMFTYLMIKFHIKIPINMDYKLVKLH